MQMARWVSDLFLDNRRGKAFESEVSLNEGTLYESDTSVSGEAYKGIKTWKVLENGKGREWNQQTAERERERERERMNSKLFLGGKFH